MLDIRLMGRWDEDEGLHLIRTSELNLPMASADDDSESNVLLSEWWSGLLKLGAPEDIPTSRIDASIQGILRRDVIEFYLAEPDGPFDETPSSYGAAGPLAVQLADGRIVLVDGNHRWAKARLCNEKTFRVQVLKRPS